MPEHKILIVEDEEAIAHVMESILSANHYMPLSVSCPFSFKPASFHRLYQKFGRLSPAPPRCPGPASPGTACGFRLSPGAGSLPERPLFPPLSSPLFPFSGPYLANSTKKPPLIFRQKTHCCDFSLWHCKIFYDIIS